jgi:Xaa-Pro dipeptidase
VRAGRGRSRAAVDSPPPYNPAMTMGEEHASRTVRFQGTLRALGLDGALLAQATDVFYFSGTRQNAALWIPTGADPVLLVRKSLARAREESAVADVRPFPRGKELPAIFAGARRVGLTLDVLPVNVHAFYARALSGAEVVDVGRAVREQRSVKSPAELALMRETAVIMTGALAELPSYLRAGMTELELTAEVEYRLRRRGNEGSPRLRGFNQELFVGLAVAGPSAVAPGFFDGPVTGRGLSAAAPLGASRDLVPRDSPILLDYTAVKNGYVVDMTRMAVVGRLDSDLERAFEVALAIQAEVAGRLRPGEVPSAIWERACAMAEEAGLGGHFMGPPGDQARFVGHGVGLELDELPVLAPGFDAPLVRGQTVAVEPKFVLPGRGAIGIENTWAVGERGGEKITDLADDIVRLA